MHLRFHGNTHDSCCRPIRAHDERKHYDVKDVWTSWWRWEVPVRLLVFRLYMTFVEGGRWKFYKGRLGQSSAWCRTVISSFICDYSVDFTGGPGKRKRSGVEPKSYQTTWSNAVDRQNGQHPKYVRRMRVREGFQNLELKNGHSSSRRDFPGHDESYFMGWYRLNNWISMQ